MTNQAMTSKGNPLTRILFATEGVGAPLILRLVLALVMFPHGAQKLFGWFGGYGWDGTMGFLTGSVGLPAPVAAFTILLEALGPILLVLGFLTRPVALGFVGIMVGAIMTVHLQHGFFMNWSGEQGGEGYEYHLLMIGGALALALTGAGRLSLDQRLFGTRA